MSNLIQQFITSYFTDNAFLATIIASMLPIIEARGAIAFGVSADFWAQPLSIFSACIAGFLGSLIMTMLLLFITYPICMLLKKQKHIKRFVEKLEDKVRKIKNKNAKLEQKENLRKYAFLSLFTALPIPLTGYYTACLIASFCQMNKFLSLVSIILGNIICVLFMSLVSALLGQYISYIFYFFVIVFVGTLLYFIFDALIKRKPKIENTTNEIDTQK